MFSAPPPFPAPLFPFTTASVPVTSFIFQKAYVIPANPGCTLNSFHVSQEPKRVPHSLHEQMKRRDPICNSDVDLKLDSLTCTSTEFCQRILNSITNLCSKVQKENHK